MILSKQDTLLWLTTIIYNQLIPPRKELEIQNYIACFPVYSFSDTVLSPNDYFSGLITFLNFRPFET